VTEIPDSFYTIAEDWRERTSFRNVRTVSGLRNIKEESENKRVK
jgi:hypothetical protein